MYLPEIKNKQTNKKIKNKKTLLGPDKVHSK